MKPENQLLEQENLSKPSIVGFHSVSMLVFVGVMCVYFPQFWRKNAELLSIGAST